MTTYSDPEKGSGAVKITPAHDFNDFEVGKRHNLELINIFDASAVVNDNAPEAYRGLPRFEARKKVVADLEALGLVDKIEPHTHMVPHGPARRRRCRALAHRAMVCRRGHAGEARSGGGAQGRDPLRAGALRR